LTLPEFTIGYRNHSIIGNQSIDGNEVFFDGTKRFHSVNVGVSFPLNFKSNKAKLQSQDLRTKALVKEAENKKLILIAQLQNAFAQYNQNLAQYNYFKTVALPNSDTMVSISRLGYNSGEIGYLEYLQALQTATDIQISYLKSADELNQSVLNIHFLTNQ
jgi:cobalt-zinc-cadmium resistance protein CzcA